MISEVESSGSLIYADLRNCDKVSESSANVEEVQGKIWHGSMREQEKR